MTKIKVGFDISPLSNGHSGRGVGFYTKSLLEALKHQSEIEIVEFKDIKKIPVVDLVHYPYFDLFNRSLDLKQPYPYLITIHDLTPILFPKYYPPGIKGQLNWQWQKWMARRANQIITISETSKKDIVSVMGINSRQVSVVYPAAGNAIKKSLSVTKVDKIRQKYNLPLEYLLYVGNVNWNKNILTICQSAIDTQKELVLVGKSFINDQSVNINHPELATYKQFLDKYANNPLIHILGYVDEADLGGIYQLAQIALFPSYYEGFGMPILEAQSYGIPVITAKTSSMPEVAGDAAILVDPYNQSELSQAINQLTDQKLRQEYIKKGYQNIKRFSWEESAKQLINIYQRIVKP